MGTIMPDLILKNEVYAIFGAAMAVSDELGAGFLEAIYQEALGIELECRSIEHQQQGPILIHYKGSNLKNGILQISSVTEKY
jgi:GxxExxY protein